MEAADVVDVDGATTGTVPDSDNHFSEREEVLHEVLSGTSVHIDILFEETKLDGSAASAEAGIRGTNAS